MEWEDNGMAAIGNQACEHWEHWESWDQWNPMAANENGNFRNGHRQPSGDYKPQYSQCSQCSQCSQYSQAFPPDGCR
jgi:hypothetical protein